MPGESVQRQLFAHVSIRSSFSYFSSKLSLRMSVSGKPRCFNMADSHLLVNEQKIANVGAPIFDHPTRVLTGITDLCGLHQLINVLTWRILTCW